MRRSKPRRTLRKRTLRKRKTRTLRTLRIHGGNYEKDATVTELEGEPIKGLNRMVVATSDGFVGSGSDFVKHAEYAQSHISTVGGFRSVFKR